MVRALTAKQIKGAGLDVFEHEPLPPGSPMYLLENVLLSPHCADHTKDWLNQAMRFFPGAISPVFQRRAAGERGRQEFGLLDERSEKTAQRYLVL